VGRGAAVLERTTSCVGKSVVPVVGPVPRAGRRGPVSVPPRQIRPDHPVRRVNRASAVRVICP